MKHYGSEYLNTTAEKLADIKKLSFNAFYKFENKKFVDLGCGNGIDLIGFSQVSSDDNELIGVDHDEHFIEIAKNNPKRKSNVNFLKMDVNQLAFEDHSIDGLRNERLIQHLTTPEKAIKEMHRVLKPNAPLTILETDWKGLSIFSGLNDIDEKISQYLVYEKINNGLATRKMINYLIDTDFKNINVNVLSNTIDSLGDANAFIMFENILLEMKESGFLSEIQHETYLNRIQLLDQQNTLRIHMSMVLFNCNK